MDSGPPSVPTSVHAAANPTRLGPVISWNASTGVPVAYEVLRNGSLIGTVNAPGTVFGDASVTADGTYSVHRARGRRGRQRLARLRECQGRLRHDCCQRAPAVTAVAGPHERRRDAELGRPSPTRDRASPGTRSRRSAAGGPAPASLNDGTAVCGTLGADQPVMRRHRPDPGLELPLRGVRPRRGRQRVRRGADPRGADPVPRRTERLRRRRRRCARRSREPGSP